MSDLVAEPGEIAASIAEGSEDFGGFLRVLEGSSLPVFETLREIPVADPGPSSDEAFSAHPGRPMLARCFREKLLGDFLRK